MERIDPNFRQKKAENGLIFKEIHETPARIHGLCEEEGAFYRAPPGVCASIGEAISALNRHTSGGRVCLTTNSRRLGVRAVLTEDCRMPHMPLSGSSSIDVFILSGASMRYRTSARPGEDATRIDAEADLGERSGMTAVTLYLPLYNGVERLEIGVEEGAEIGAPPPLTYEKPLVFYGSSITQGGCASRPANSYTAMAARALDSDFINLGFSGQAKGDPAMADYIAGLDMSAFIYDYDHNAPDGDFLRQTHLPFLKRILQRRPDLPVVIMTRPDPDFSETDYERRDAVLATYEWGVSQKYPVYFVDGWTMFGSAGRDCCTVDGCHPNDLGFYRMAQAVYPTLYRILNASRPPS